MIVALFRISNQPSSNLTFGAGGKDKDGNNITGWGYYEVHFLAYTHSSRPHTHVRRLQTIAGGSGAGPGWHGTDGVHTHITNTRIGDVEILERRYPLIVHQFGIREGSGGKGQWRGGDGVVRDIEFLEPLQVSILSEVSPSRLLYSENLVSDICCRDEPGNRTVSRVASPVHLGATHGSSSCVHRMGMRRRTRANH